jgi:hypothetical protein
MKIKIMMEDFMAHFKPIVILASLVLLMSCTTLIDQVSYLTNKDPYLDQIEDNIVIVLEVNSLMVKNARKDQAMPTSSVGQASGNGIGFPKPDIQPSVSPVAQPVAFDEYFKQEIKKYFDSIGLESKVLVVTGLELNPRTIEDEIEESKATKVLYITGVGEKLDIVRTPGSSYTTTSPGGYGVQTHYIAGTTTTYNTYYFDIHLEDLQLGRKIWRSRMIISGNPVCTTNTIDEFIHDLILSLKNDLALNVAEDKLPAYSNTKTDVLTPAAIIIGSLCLLFEFSLLSQY